MSPRPRPSSVRPGLPPHARPSDHVERLRHLATIALDRKLDSSLLARHLHFMQHAVGEEASAHTWLTVQQMTPRCPILTPAQVAAELLHRAHRMDAGAVDRN